MTLKKDYFGRGMDIMYPGDKVDYSMYWGSALRPGQTLANSIWEVSTITDVTLDDSQVIGGNVTSIIVSMSETAPIGTQYTLTNTITIAQESGPNLIETRAIILECGIPSAA